MGSEGLSTAIMALTRAKQKLGRAVSTVALHSQLRAGTGAVFRGCRVMLIQATMGMVWLHIPKKTSDDVVGRGPAGLALVQRTGDGTSDDGIAE